VALATVTNKAVEMGMSTTCYKGPKPAEVFLGAPDDKLSTIVNHAIVDRPWSAKLATKAWDVIATNLSINHPDIFQMGISGMPASN
jgi:hypothetical protein